MKSMGTMDQAELAAYVQPQVREMGVDVVLSDGAAVAIYILGDKVSMDIDLVPTCLARHRDMIDAWG